MTNERIAEIKTAMEAISQRENISGVYLIHDLKRVVLELVNNVEELKRAIIESSQGINPDLSCAACYSCKKNRKDSGCKRGGDIICGDDFSAWEFDEAQFTDVEAKE